MICIYCLFKFFQYQICRRKLDSKCEALLILSKDLDQIRQERDQFKLMAEQVQERYQALKRQLAGVVSFISDYIVSPLILNSQSLWFMFTWIISSNIFAACPIALLSEQINLVTEYLIFLINQILITQSIIKCKTFMPNPMWCVKNFKHRYAEEQFWKLKRLTGI